MGDHLGKDWSLRSSWPMQFEWNGVTYREGDIIPYHVVNDDPSLEFWIAMEEAGFQCYSIAMHESKLVFTHAIDETPAYRAFYDLLQEHATENAHSYAFKEKYNEARYKELEKMLFLDPDRKQIEL